MRRALVIGIGNVLRGDDGAGPAVVARLEDRGVPHGVSCVTTHQLTPELAERLADVSMAIFVDASVDVEPGDVRVHGFSIADARLRPPVGHLVDPQGLLALGRLAYGAAPIAWMVAIGGASYGYEEGLTAQAERGVDAAVAEVLRLIGMTG